MIAPFEGQWVVVEASIVSGRDQTTQFPLVGRVQYRAGDWAQPDGYSVRSHPSEVVHIHRSVPTTGRAPFAVIPMEVA